MQHALQHHFSCRGPQHCIHPCHVARFVAGWDAWLGARVMTTMEGTDGRTRVAAGLKVLTDEEVDALVAELDAEKAAADAARRNPGQSATS